MTMEEALQIMKGQSNGFMVSFERRDSYALVSDHFPDVKSGEPAIETEEEAWRMARQFAAKTQGRCLNVRVIHSDYSPVSSSINRVIKNR